MEEILIKEMLSAYSNLSRQIEFLNVKMFGLTQLLLNKGIITESEYDKYCSDEAVADIYRNINKKLEDEFND